MGPFRPAPFAPMNAETVERLKRSAEEHGLDFERDVSPRLYDHPGELFVNKLTK